MAKKGTKVKELAAELGVTSHAIIARCRAEGFAVQNSITRLKPDLEQSVRAWFAGGATAEPPPSDTTDPASP